VLVIHFLFVSRNWQSDVFKFSYNEQTVQFWPQQRIRYLYRLLLLNTLIYCM